MRPALKAEQSEAHPRNGLRLIIEILHPIVIDDMTLLF